MPAKLTPSALAKEPVRFLKERGAEFKSSGEGGQPTTKSWVVGLIVLAIAGCGFTWIRQSSTSRKLIAMSSSSGIHEGSRNEGFVSAAERKEAGGPSYVNRNSLNLRGGESEQEVITRLSQIGFKLTECQTRQYSGVSTAVTGRCRDCNFTRDDDEKLVISFYDGAFQRLSYIFPASHFEQIHGTLEHTYGKPLHSQEQDEWCSGPLPCGLIDILRDNGGDSGHVSLILSKVMKNGTQSDGVISRLGKGFPIPMAAGGESTAAESARASQPIGASHRAAGRQELCSVLNEMYSKRLRKIGADPHTYFRAAATTESGVNALVLETNAVRLPADLQDFLQGARWVPRAYEAGFQGIRILNQDQHIACDVGLVTSTTLRPTVCIAQWLEQGSMRQEVVREWPHGYVFSIK
jgi:hypothetical protein